LLPALRRSAPPPPVVATPPAGAVGSLGGAAPTAGHTAQRRAAPQRPTPPLELNGERVRVVEICPGMVHTEGFSLVRYHGDQSKADAVYEGVDRPLTAEDVAECIAFG